jgi:hypothetical protein
MLLSLEMAFIEHLSAAAVLKTDAPLATKPFRRSFLPAVHRVFAFVMRLRDRTLVRSCLHNGAARYWVTTALGRE